MNFFFQDPEFGSRMITLMAAAMLVIQFLMVGQRILVTNIRLFAVQSFLLAGIANTIAYFQHSFHLYAIALFTLVLKSLVVPWFLKRIIDRIGIQHEIQPFVNIPASLLVCGGLTLLGYGVVQPFAAAHSSTEMGHNILAVALALALVGFFLMINRRKALSQVLALLTIENGMLLAAISLTYGMPLVVELGVFFDMFVLAIVCGILIFRIRESFDSMDVSKLSNLKG